MDEVKEVKAKKFTSRKFIVWIVATVFVFGGFVITGLTKDTTVLSQIIGWWGGISTAYIGGNVAQKYIYEQGEKSE